jgi:NADH:ubiquinone oxidoreductase subunit 5 (subunit L)/multisubunit Na+/H+ antiporter MnhA subunit
VEELKDIKPFEIISINFVPYIIMLSLLLVLIVIIVYFIFKKEKILTKKEKAIIVLKNLDYKDDIKNIAYNFTIYGKISVDDLYKDEFYQIVEKLEIYKYRQFIDKSIDNDLIDLMKEYIKVRL